MSEDRLGNLRALSQAAFGQRYRLELMLAVADSPDGIVCLTDLARSLDISISNLQQPLKALVTTGLLSPLPVTESRRKFYIRNPSSAWAWASELANDVSPVDRTAHREEGEITRTD
ncbi:transcriptional regulator [Amycolatopsis roodepoortensis]|uniref:transcriptional regulator n=1 Tax=Amycolatopsis roodepoortensis TaxID=700274 RepID=UPI00214C1329|nr:transcriptional regulator [Amycolatopsis roodepoortensis]UUV28699.1 transcriptional regulator [Amycolatopsis roodepoortensis]